MKTNFFKKKIAYIVIFSIVFDFFNGILFGNIPSAGAIVLGQIDNTTDSFVTMTGSVGLSNLEVGGVYSLMSGSTLVSSGVLVASNSTGSLELNPSFFTNYGNYTLTLSGSSSGTTTSSIGTKNLFIGPIDYQDLYVNQVAPTLSSSGITTNLGNVTYANVQSFSGLYFEEAGKGKISFSNSLDLTNSGTITFLQNLPSKLNITDGNINFDPTDSDFANFGAVLSMYFSTGSTFITGISNPESFVVKTSTGQVIDSSGVLSNIHGACGVGDPFCVLVFDTTHFTSFDLRPLLTGVSIHSNNISSGSIAGLGDQVTLSFTGSESLTGVVVSFNGASAASVNGSGSVWTATSQAISTGSGLVNFTINYSDLTGNSGSTITSTTDSSSVVINNQGPSIPTITTANTLTGQTSINITGTGDINEFVKILSGSTVVGTGVIDGSGSFSVVVNLVEGINTFTAKSYDSSDNNSGNSNSVTITRDTISPVINYKQVKDVSETQATLEFKYTESNITNPNSNIIVNIGATNYSKTFSGNVGTSTMTGLTSDTSYTYTLSVSDDAGNTTTSTGNFSTAKQITGTGNLVETGAVSFGFTGSLSSGNTYTLSGANLIINSDSNDNDFLTGSLTLSGVNIIVASGSWNGILIPPTLISQNSSESATGSEVGSGVTIVQTIKTGAEGASLSSTGGYFNVSFMVSGYSSGAIFNIYRSENGNTWALNTPDPTCVLNSTSICTFRTDHLSFFAPGLDSTPDSFSFTSLTDKELSTIYESNAITISGISTGTTISISGGEYKIGTGSYTSASGTVNNGNTITVRLTSSSSFNTLTTATLTIGGVSAGFNVTTKQSTSSGGSSSGGGSGGGGGGSGGGYGGVSNGLVKTMSGVVTPNKGISKYISKISSVNELSLKIDKRIEKSHKENDAYVLQLRNNLIKEIEKYLEISKTGTNSEIMNIRKSVLAIYKNLLDELKYKPYVSTYPPLVKLTDKLDKKISSRIKDQTSIVWQYRNQFVELLDKYIKDKNNLNRQEKLNLRSQVIDIYNKILDEMKK